MTLVPYGSTKFRISMFPVTAEPQVKASAIRRILFLGNSITLHGPKADILGTNLGIRHGARSPPGQNQECTTITLQNLAVDRIRLALGYE